MAANKTKMGKHVSFLGGLYIVLDILFLIAGAIILGLILLAGEAFQSPAGEAISEAVAIGAGVFLLLLAVFGLVVGIGLLQRKSWARVIALILGVINLFNVPIGTILGIYTLWVLLNPETADEFGGNGRQSQAFGKEQHAV